MTKYFDNLCKAMTWLGEQPNTMFIGQAVGEPGTAMFTTLKDVPMSKRIEMPVAENMQMGIATGMSLTGCVPICIYPRINFLLCAIDQLVNHLDKLPLYSDYKPKVIIRTAIACDKPLDPGVQHLGNYFPAIREMLSTVSTVCLEDPQGGGILRAYQEAYLRIGPTLIIEDLSLYGG